jgi:NADPH:quinone reductase-like Zn-dependent oxidoreductase
MKAACINSFGNENVFEIIDNHPVPEPKEDEILIKVSSSSINPVDYKHRMGNHKYILGSPFPIVLGYDVAGIVEKTGSNALDFKPGDRVFGRLNRKYGGALAEYAAASESCFAKLNKNIPLNEAAAYPLAALTALQALRDKGKITAGMQVLITGATGGVGHFAVQIAKLYGAHVTAVCGAGHETILETLQPNEIIRYTESNYINQLKTYDIIFDCAGKLSYRKTQKLINKGGSYISTLPRMPILYHKPLAWLAGKKVKTLLMKPERSDLELVNNWIMDKKLFVYIDQTFPLDAVAEAHAYAQSGMTEGKIVIDVIKSSPN